jgi:hypothetical protein
MGPMKKWKLILISLVLIWSFMLHSSWSAMAQGSFKDIESHWAKDTILQLVDRGIINGYADGTFRPDNSINRDEYIKLVVAALGYELTNGPDYWAQPFIDKALELGLIREGEFKAYDTPIHREEMASIIVKAANIQEDAPTSMYDHLLPKLIPDYDKIAPKYKAIVEKSYQYGLIVGKPNYHFDPKGRSTRAEAATVIMRLLDDQYRNPFSEVIENDTAMQTGYIKDLTNPYMAYPLYEKNKNRVDMKSFGSGDELFKTMKAVLEHAKKFNITLDEEAGFFTVTIPEFDPNVFDIKVSGKFGKHTEPGTYQIPIDVYNDSNGVVFGISIVNTNDRYRGSWVLYREYGYFKNGKYYVEKGSIAEQHFMN